MKLVMCFLLVLFSFNSLAGEVLYFFDSNKHPEPSFFVNRKIDVSIPSKIEQAINKKLVLENPYLYTEAEREQLARSMLRNDETLKGLMSNLASSYKELETIFKYQVHKVPAVVLVENGRNWIVYGETNIQKALVIIRNSSKYRSTYVN
ncbi:DUF1525 domain-containing protein [Pseudoalteromonas luteoviolacea]|uniref:Integrating conjugative element protein n=1 Tax=Pseudoalteromonas luteoviolacea S4060-1 TaxID=1365257 RepID=A0A162BKD5_9GAMM|nr:DUF1525 domain-containing protein [Pseudoalteromonas luteoviolacea]KZN63396.1 hypothetical protein N478_03845 [Pseudoalteromonas luteoviolacea S4060-1]